MGSRLADPLKNFMFTFREPEDMSFARPIGRDNVRSSVGAFCQGDEVLGDDTRAEGGKMAVVFNVWIFPGSD